MIRNIFATALNRIFRNKVYSLINIIGLTIGITGALLIFLFVRYEFSFDTFHRDKDRIFRLVGVPYQPGTGFQPSPSVPLPVGDALKIGYSRIENVCSVFGRDAQLSVQRPNQHQEDNFNEDGGIYFAERHFLKFSISLHCMEIQSRFSQNPIRLSLPVARLRNILGAGKLQ
jgi:hypothetical protein